MGWVKGGSVSKKKSELRRDMKIVLSRLDPRWTSAASKDICERLLKMLDDGTFPMVTNILAWVSFFDGEVDLSSFLIEAVKSHSIYLPRIDDKEKMTFHKVISADIDDLVSGVLGIPEPRHELPLYNTNLASQSLVIVPGLAFDKDGNRLGRGKGYYDRFLSYGGMNKAHKIGVCFELQLVDTVYTEGHDVGVDFVCHERAYIRTVPMFEDDLSEL